MKMSTTFFVFLVGVATASSHQEPALARRQFPDFSFDGDDVKFDGETEAAQKQTGKLAHSRRQFPDLSFDGDNANFDRLEEAAQKESGKLSKQKKGKPAPL